jgi:hypothetical protein
VQNSVAAGTDPQRATERVAVLMTPTERAAYAHRNTGADTGVLAEEEALEAALKQVPLLQIINPADFQSWLVAHR